MNAPPLPQRLLTSCALPQRWADLPCWTVLDSAFAQLTPFLHCWHAWHNDTRRPRMLHYVGLLSAAQAQHLPALAHAAARDTPAWQTLAGALAQASADLSAGQHRILLAQGQLSLTLCVGDTGTLLAEQQFQANTLWVHGEVPALDKWHAKALARCSQRGAQMALRSTAPEALAHLTETGFVDVVQEGDWHYARFAPRWSLGLRDQAPAPLAPRRCTVVGAGISGASVACALARRGWQVTVLDRHAAAAGGASGLPAGLVVPHVSADDSPRSRMSRVGARLTLQHAATLLQHGSDWHASGVQERSVEADATRWHAQGAWIRPARLVQAWLGQPNIRCVYQAEVTTLEQTQAVWRLRGRDGTLWAESELVVLANATGCAPLLLAPEHAHYLGEGLAQRLESLHAVHGTASWALHGPSPVPTHWPPHPVNGHGSFLPRILLDDGMGWLTGSTFEPDCIPEQTGHRLAPLAEQHHANARRLQTLLPAVAADLAPSFAQGTVQHWSATRCVTHDRLPLVGPLQDAREDMPATLWIHTGMGARGLSFAALGAEWLAARLGAEPWPLESSLARSLDVQRARRKR